MGGKSVPGAAEFAAHDTADGSDQCAVRASGGSPQGDRARARPRSQYAHFQPEGSDWAVSSRGICEVRGGSADSGTAGVNGAAPRLRPTTETANDSPPAWTERSFCC